MAKVVCACIALLLSALPVMAGDPGDVHNVQLTPGQFTVEGGWATQMLAAKNNGGPLGYVMVECAFLRGSHLLTTSPGLSTNIGAGQTAYIKVVAEDAARAAGADHTDCRIVSAQAAENGRPVFHADKLPPLPARAAVGPSAKKRTPIPPHSGLR
jgi:hypothetical protein